MSARLQSAAHAAEVRGLIAPTRNGNLLLPSAAVAEVVTYSGDVRVREGGPEWFLGVLDWRGLRPPLIDLGALGGDAPMPADARTRWRRPCVLVSFSLTGNQALPYVGFLVADSPHLVRIHPGDLVTKRNSASPRLVLYAAELQGDPVWIPDLDEVERQVLRLSAESDTR